MHSPPVDFRNPGTEPEPLLSLTLGGWVLYHLRHLGSLSILHIYVHIFLLCRGVLEINQIIKIFKFMVSIKNQR